MKIKVEKWTFDGSESYKVVDISQCCDSIRSNPLIDFYVECFENSEDEYGLGLCKTDTYPEPWEDYYTTSYQYYKINYCPFCGEPITIEIVDSIDKNAEYKQIKTEVYDLRKKINKCDSKKKEAQMESEFRKKNDLLNQFYQNGNIRVKPNNCDKH